MMIPLFSPFDRDFYVRIIPCHKADIESYPSEILQCLRNGGFTVSISGHKWCVVALDEVHEMCKDKDLKAAVMHPTKSNLQKKHFFLTTTLNFIRISLKNYFQKE